MRIPCVSAVTVAVLGVALLAGCRSDGLEAEAEAASSVSSGATAGAKPPAADSAKPTPTDTASGPAASADAPARRVVEAPSAAGLPRMTGDGAVSDLVIDPGQMRDGMDLVMSNYARSATESGEVPILVVAVDNVPEPTTERREHLWRGMLEHIQWDYDLGQPQAEPVDDPGPLGGSVECMLASLAEDGDVICGWADATTAGVAHFPNSTLPEASRLFVSMRADLEK